MITTWNQRLYRAAKTYLNHSLLDESQIKVVKRPLFFGKYRWGLHFSPDVSVWTLYHSVRHIVFSRLSGLEYHFVGSTRALYYNIYGNDTRTLYKLIPYHNMLEFSSLRIIAPECWHLTQPRPHNKGKFYHKYSYRAQLLDPNEMNPAMYAGLMSSDWVCAQGFFYCEDVRDVILFKLLHGGDIATITERG